MPSEPTRGTGSASTSVINADRPRLWRADITISDARFTDWLSHGGRRAYMTARDSVRQEVSEMLRLTDHLRVVTPEVLRPDPALVATLRMCTAPALARDRLAGLAQARKPFVAALEQGRLPTSASAAELDAQLGRICRVLRNLWDRQLLPWLVRDCGPTDLERQMASVVVADRRCIAVSDLILRQAHKRSQTEQLVRWLTEHGYRQQAVGEGCVESMPQGTFAIDQPVVAGSHTPVLLTLDAVVQPHSSRGQQAPVFLDWTSLADASAAKLAKEATRLRLLKETFGGETAVLSILVGSFDKQYLDARATRNLDWIWEHRLDDLGAAGV